MKKLNHMLREIAINERKSKLIEKWKWWVYCTKKFLQNKLFPFFHKFKELFEKTVSTAKVSLDFRAETKTCKTVYW
jgi:hypothetical protein